MCVCVCVCVCAGVFEREREGVCLWVVGGWLCGTERERANMCLCTCDICFMYVTDSYCGMHIFVFS